MALINCNECGKEISDKASTCPNCGAPVEKGFPESDSISDNKLNPNIFSSTSTVKKKKRGKTGCLIILLIFAWATIYGLMQSAKESENHQTISDSSASKEDSKDELLKFDEESWKDFKILFTSHNNFMKNVLAYSEGDISSLDFYNACTEAKEYFQEASTYYDYGTNDDEETYLNVFETVALADQQAAEYLMDYIDSGKTSHLSKAQEYIQRAKDGVVMIAQNRGLLLVKAGLSDEEIKTKVETDMNELEE
jgi:coenzyme F420-reducing hydrogenase alpha subunit